MIQKTTTHPEMEIVTDPDVLAKAKAQDEQFQRNWAWFDARAAKIYSKHCGKVLCVAGQQIFAADTSEDALAMAKSAHPEDAGFFTIIVPKTTGYRIYAH
jgi:hypothetical protein